MSGTMMRWIFGMLGSRIGIDTRRLAAVGPVGQHILLNEALAQPEIQAHLKKPSAEVFGGSVDKTAKYLRGEIDRWGGVIKAAKIEIQ
jgi:hypothetical protein